MSKPGPWYVTIQVNDERIVLTVNSTTGDPVTPDAALAHATKALVSTFPDPINQIELISVSQTIPDRPDAITPKDLELLQDLLETNKIESQPIHLKVH
jgi:hypothetical protein